MPSCEAADHCNSQDEPSKAAPVSCAVPCPYTWCHLSILALPEATDTEIGGCSITVTLSECSRSSGCSMGRALCSGQRTKYSVCAKSVHEKKNQQGLPGDLGAFPSGPARSPLLSALWATCPGLQALPRCAVADTGRCKLWWQGCPAYWVAQRRALPPQGGHSGWESPVLPSQLVGRGECWLLDGMQDAVGHGICQEAEPSVLSGLHQCLKSSFPTEAVDPKA